LKNFDYKHFVNTGENIALTKIAEKSIL